VKLFRGIPNSVNCVLSSEPKLEEFVFKHRREVPKALSSVQRTYSEVKGDANLTCTALCIGHDSEPGRSKVE